MLHYEISGSGKTVLVLLHGFMESTEVWYDMLPELEKNFTVLRIDLPGHGKSPSNDKTISMESMATAVRNTLEKLKIYSFHLLGHSMGGYVSLSYAERYPGTLKSLTLFFSSPLPDSEDKKNIRHKSLQIIKEDFKKYIALGIPNLFNPNEKEKLDSKIELAKEIALKTPIKGALASVKGMLERTDKREVLENIHLKVLIISGRLDLAVNTFEMIKSLPENPNIKIYTLDCGHNGHWEKPTICTEIIKTELIS
ncbi:alpha/beta fold hydrolase [Elizabethkingia argentiflava]|uniref:Alpha/beta fold hydrolase n=1 Tax=Elizabethkingia argenteiflava TaxID=2681556 RepID=A0A845PUD5_9FLAO|nr:alpha/beta fold hydrolase [Elizabethkingia argenteiflava]NAW51265.1 alpha/beta fold hydrolase [Elizabethkingia argenteiflava]